MRTHSYFTNQISVGYDKCRLKLTFALSDMKHWPSCRAGYWYKHEHVNFCLCLFLKSQLFFCIFLFQYIPIRLIVCSLNYTVSYHVLCYDVATGLGDIVTYYWHVSFHTGTHSIYQWFDTYLTFKATRVGLLYARLGFVDFRSADVSATWLF